jgi:hypothetical protein
MILVILGSWLTKNDRDHGTGPAGPERHARICDVTAPTGPAPAPRQPVWGGPYSGVGCRIVVAGYALLGTAGCGYLFYLSTLPVRIPDDWGAQAPAWLGTLALFGTLLLGLPWALLPLLLFFAGRAHLRQAAPAAVVLRALWAAAVAAVLGLETLVILRAGYRMPPPTYMGPGLVSWVAAAEAASFLVLGAAMLATLTAADQAARPSHDRSPPPP